LGKFRVPKRKNRTQVSGGSGANPTLKANRGVRIFRGEGSGSIQGLEKIEKKGGESITDAGNISLTKTPG